MAFSGTDRSQPHDRRRGDRGLEKFPLFKPSEAVRIGPYPAISKLAGKCGVVVRILDPVAGENRYAVMMDSGVREVFLECTLEKIFLAGSWNHIAQIWQPKREAR